MLQYTKIGVNILTGLVVTTILLISFVLIQMKRNYDNSTNETVSINSNNEITYEYYYDYFENYMTNIWGLLKGVSKIIIAKNGLVLDIANNISDKYQKISINKIWLEIQDIDVSILEEDDTIILLSENGNALYRISKIDELLENDMSNLSDDKNQIIIVQKKSKNINLVIQADRVGGLNERKKEN